MQVKQIKLTPLLAQQILEGNTENRPANDAHVRNLADEMVAGRWKLNGDTICRSGGKLIDGQHRCLAVIKSGVTVDALLVDDLPGDVFDTKDNGKRRTGGDVLAVKGEKHYALLAATLQFIHRYKQGKTSTSRAPVSNSMMMELLSKYPDARKSVAFCRLVGTKKLVPGSMLAGLHFLMTEIDADAADYFWKSLIAGCNLAADNPVFVLRERLMANSVSKSRLKPIYLIAVTIKAWNFSRAGASLKQLRWHESGPAAEPFPSLN